MRAFRSSYTDPDWARPREKLGAFAGGLTLVLLATFIFSASAASPYPVASSGYLLRNWGTEDGLPENSATAIVQTQDGYLWFGTFNGLVRFNGESFTVFNPANTPQLADAGIVNLHADQRDRLWVSTSAGLVVKDGAQWRAFGTNDGWVGNFVRTFAERANGDLLMTTFDGHVLALEKDQLTELPPPPGELGLGYFGAVDENGRWWAVQHRFVGYWNGQQWIQVHAPTPTLGRSRVACAAARGGGVWVLLGKDLLKFRGSNEVFRLSLPRLKGGIWSMTEDSRTNIWICSYDSGLFRVTPEGDLIRWTMTNGLGTLSMRLVFEDQEENLWLGSSGGGLTLLRPQRFFEMDSGSSSSGRVARSVSSARNGGIYVAFYDAGLFHHTEMGAAHVFVPGPHNESVYGLSVLEDRAGRVWYGDLDCGWMRRDQGPFEKVPLKSPAGAQVGALFEDSQGRVWMATREGLVVYNGTEFQHLGPESGLPPGQIVCFGEDSFGVLWVAGAGGVLRRGKDQFTALRSADNQPLQGVICLKADADGAMWMGTRSAGLLRWRDGTIDRIGVEHGLPEREIRGIVEDAQGYFWMPSNRGIIRVNRKQLHAVADGAALRLEIQLLDRADGLPSPECYTGQPTCALDTAGRLWFATQKGVVGIDPAGFRVNPRPPPVLVERLTYRVPATETKTRERRPPSGLGDEEISVTSPFSAPLRLPPGAYGLEVQFAVLSFSAPEKVRFQYLLEGINPGWKDAEGDRVVRFHQLPAGNYIFRVRAANNDGVWDQTGTALAFSVRPFFWQTWWFRFGSGLLLVASGSAFVWSWSRRRIALAVERERLAHETLELREELAHSSRVSTMGQLASALAHELSQPLSAILRNTEAAEILIQESPPDLPEIREILTDIRLDDQRATGVIDRMRRLLKRQKAERTPLAVGALLDETAALVRADALRRKTQLALDVPADLPLVHGDRIQLQQVLLNLFLNGMDAMSGQSPETRRLVVQARKTGEQTVELRVRDFGPGIPKPDLPHVFEPFFSTKPDGMGMGLAVSKTIIEAHEGRLWAENGPDGGACFCIVLPVVSTAL